MKITQKIIDDLEKALDMRKKNGDEIWPVSYTHLTLPTRDLV